MGTMISRSTVYPAWIPSFSSRSGFCAKTGVETEDKKKSATASARQRRTMLFLIIRVVGFSKTGRTKSREFTGQLNAPKPELSSSPVHADSLVVPAPNLRRVAPEE